MTKRWRDELKYCASLLRSGGDENVSRSQVMVYLDEQGKNATKDKDPEITAALSQAVHWMKRGRWNKAKDCIKSIL